MRSKSCDFASTRTQKKMFRAAAVYLMASVIKEKMKRAMNDEREEEKQKTN